jgi:hypothetical protein
MDEEKRETLRMVGSGVGWCFEFRDEIWNCVKSVTQWFRPKSVGNVDGIPEVLILGAGGVGKTTLAKTLTLAEQTYSQNPGEYEESLEVETHAFSDAPAISFVVPPGQRYRRELTWSRFLDRISEGGFRGIIVVGAYGYHSLGRISFKTHDMYVNAPAEDQTPERFLEKYSRACRDDECDVLRSVAARVKMCDRPIALATIVTKEDVWWPERDAVHAHYEKEWHEEIVADLLASKKNDGFKYEHARISLVINRFETGMNEILRENSQGYGEKEKHASLDALFKKLAAIKAWEDSR